MDATELTAAIARLRGIAATWSGASETAGAVVIVCDAAERVPTMADLLRRCREYLRTDGEAVAPEARALAAEIERAI